jgi:hypothetical protein
MNIKKPTLGMKEPIDEQPANNGMRPKNPSANTIPSVGYVLEVNWKVQIGFRDVGSGDASSPGTQEEISTNPGQYVRRKRAYAQTGRAD